MKRLVLWCFFWCTAIMVTLAEEVPQVVNVMARQTTSVSSAEVLNMDFMAIRTNDGRRSSKVAD